MADIGGIMGGAPCIGIGMGYMGGTPGGIIGAPGGIIGGKPGGINGGILGIPDGIIPGIPGIPDGIIPGIPGMPGGIGIMGWGGNACPGGCMGMGCPIIGPGTFMGPTGRPGLNNGKGA